MSTKKKLLIVDDQEMVLLFISRIIDSSRFECVMANGVKLAAAFLEREKFDIVVTDFHMPDGTGEDVRRFAVLHGVPEIYLHTSDEDRYSMNFNKCYGKYDRTLLKMFSAPPLPSKSQLG